MMPTRDIHGFNAKYEAVLKQLKKSTISDKNKDLVRDFDRAWLGEEIDGDIGRNQKLHGFLFVALFPGGFGQQGIIALSKVILQNTNPFWKMNFDLFFSFVFLFDFIHFYHHNFSNLFSF